MEKGAIKSSMILVIDMFSSHRITGLPKAPITMWLRARRPAMERVIGDVWNFEMPGMAGMEGFV